MGRIRLEKLLVQRKIANDILHARELIDCRIVLVNGAIQSSYNSAVDPGCAIELLKQKPRYISRGGMKLENALKVFNVDVKGKRCLDIGASTGGFTDCLLQHGAKEVVAVDVGHGQLDLSLREDERVVVMERTNAKDLTPLLIERTSELAVMDVSFTSVIPIIEPVVKCLNPIELIILIKPQFECEQSKVNTRGVVADKQSHIDCIVKVRDSLANRLSMIDIVVSPIKGIKGNVEYLTHIVELNNGTIDMSRIIHTVKYSQVS